MVNQTPNEPQQIQPIFHHLGYGNLGSRFNFNLKTMDPTLDPSSKNRFYYKSPQSVSCYDGLESIKSFEEFTNITSPINTFHDLTRYDYIPLKWQLNYLANFHQTIILSELKSNIFHPIQAHLRFIQSYDATSSHCSSLHRPCYWATSFHNSWTIRNAAIRM